MTAVASPARVSSVPTTAHVSFLHTLRSEWIKFLSVRSTAWILGVTVLVMVGFSLMMAAGMSFAADPELNQGQPMPADAAVGTMVATFGYSIGQIVLVVLGVMRISGEYSTGQIRSSLSAVPTRLPVLAAKAVVVAAASFVVGLVAVALATLATTPILEPLDMAVELGNGDVQRSLLGVPLYLTAIALFSLGVGAMLRHTAGGIAAVLGVLLVLPIIGQVPLEWVQDIAPYLPSAAGERLITGDLVETVLSPWQGYLVLLGWVAAALIGAAVLLRRRDA